MPARDSACHGENERPYDPLLASLDWPRIADLLHLSKREAEVVQLALEGESAAEIAQNMNLALGTVKTYSSRARSKMGVSDQRELALAVMAAAQRVARKGP